MVQRRGLIGATRRTQKATSRSDDPRVITQAARASAHLILGTQSWHIGFAPFVTCVAAIHTSHTSL